MIKVCTRAFVFKFVGGDSTARLCHYCRKNRKGGMVCVYSNCEHDDGPSIFVCPDCVRRGCKESENAWNQIAKIAKKYRRGR